jgi:ABC-type polysaccharide/polyol phosphate export permease
VLALEDQTGTKGVLDADGGPAARRLRHLFAYRTLIKYLVLKEIKVKSRGTFFGVAWTLMNPLFTIIVYFFVFRHIFRVPIPNFLAFFLLGFLMWVFFARTATMAATAILDNENIVKRSAFPLEVLPLTVVLYNLFHHLIALGLAVPLMLAFWGATFSWHLLWVGAVLTAFVAFTLAVSLWLTTVGVFFRDTRDILEVVLPMVFWATPIFYLPEMAPGFLQPALRMNPLTSFIAAMRAVVIDGHNPSGGQLGLMLLWLSATLVSGVWVFVRYRPRFAEEA